MPFDIGFIEICVLLVIGLAVLGPDKLPVAARQLSKWFSSIRRSVNSFTSEVNRELEMDELRRQIEAQKQQLNSVLGERVELNKTTEQSQANANTADTQNEVNLSENIKTQKNSANA